MISSIIQVEARFNSRLIHHYDWVFFNNEPFTEHFKASILNVTSGDCFFETIPDKHWSIPEWIDKSRFGVGREFMGSIGVGKSWLESYHHIPFFTCNVNYDVFRFMRDNKKDYGFNMAILDDARSFPSLWDRTQNFLKKHPEMKDQAADMEWLLHTQEELGTNEYNNCQFYSNFEIGSLNFFRGPKHQAFFNHLDQAGGFYYERYGDAPVHTLSQGIPGLQCGCTVTTLDENFTKLVPFESKQRKPIASCIRRWLGRLYLLPNVTKRPLAEVIKAGGDGYGGWRIEGLESNPFHEKEDIEHAEDGKEKKGPETK
ncbi:nucleotide-diphospho-sugar transferase [Microdochium trichocladiopsis]|uniref:Nucleotide-diphospho-sugar transferase n=1 Tax=Microdochium trichocladiopsis TaxID=1682393 RepID=A0A9P9BNR0_9PEZI|nr:nucleotide-diphospho-sugar transferase [Microdochium trichocladiopsis]KAH7027998.1 nucleotide-diphospho-sugar transferase [Microdochium trichocladiopsis]